VKADHGEELGGPSPVLEEVKVLEEGLPVFGFRGLRLQGGLASPLERGGGSGEEVLPPSSEGKARAC